MKVPWFKAPAWLVVVAALVCSTALGALIAYAMRSPGLLVAVVGGALLAPLALLAAGGLKRLLLAVIVLDMSLGIDLHLFYREELGDLGAIGGLNISLTTLALAALYALWLMELLGARFTATKPRLAGLVWALIYVGFTGVSTAVAPDLTLASFEFLLLLQMLLFILYLVSNVRSRGDVVFIVVMLMVGLALQGLITIFTGITQRIIDLVVITNWLDPVYRSGTIWRSGGTHGSPNTVAAFFSMLLAPALAIALTQRRSALVTWAYLAFAIGFVALVVTRSRGGWVAVAVGILIVLVVLLWQKKLKPRALASIVAGLLFFAPFVLPLVWTRIQSDDHGALAGRAPLNLISWRMIAANPMTGAGPNHFAASASDYMMAAESRAWFYTVHNKYLLVWAESGSFALLGFIGFLLTGLRLAWWVVRRNDPLFGPLALGLGASIAGHLIHMGFDIFNGRVIAQLLWLSIAVLAIMAAASRPDATSPATRGAMGQPSPATGRQPVTAGAPP